MSESTEGVTNNTGRSRFELTRDGETAFLAYEQSPDALTLVHTDVPVAMRGHHAGETLVKAALEYARQQHLRVVAVCPFVRAYLRKHPYGW
jgi:predicted GNAT family acetyltransferase